MRIWFFHSFNIIHISFLIIWIITKCLTPILRNSNANTSTGSPLRIPYFWNYKTVKHKEFYLIFAYLTHQKGKNNCRAAGEMFLSKTVILSWLAELLLFLDVSLSLRNIDWKLIILKFSQSLVVFIWQAFSLVESGGILTPPSPPLYLSLPPGKNLSEEANILSWQFFKFSFWNF